MTQPAPKAIASATSSPAAAGQFINPTSAQIVSNGTLVIQLHAPINAVMALSGGGEVVNSPFVITLDANGVPSANQSMYGSDQYSNPLNPGYDIKIYDVSGNFISKISNVSIAGTSPLDLTTGLATQIGTVSPTAIITNPVSTQTINGQPLNLAGALLGFAAAGINTPDTGISRISAGQLAIGNGTQGDSSGRLYTSINNANVTPVTVTGTTAQTILQSLTVITAELNTVRRSITVKARGTLSAGATPGTWTLVLKIGSTNLLSTTVTPGANTTNIPWWYEADIMVQASGATGALEVGGTELLTGVTTFAFTNTGNPVTGINLTGSPVIALFCTNTQTATSCTSRQMVYQRNN